MWGNLECPIKSRSSIKAGGDVATRGASDRVTKLQSSSVTKGGGTWHVLLFLKILFKNDLISVVDLKSYNG